MKKLVAICFVAMAALSLIAQSAGDLGQLTANLQKQYEVVTGDTLQAISGSQYGEQKIWPFLWWGNRDSVRDPDLIEPGQKLGIYKLPFSVTLSSPAERKVLAEFYAKAYSRYLELGAEKRDERHWVLLEALSIDPDFLATRYSTIDPSDIQWYEARTGKKVVAAAQPAPAPTPAPAPAAQPAQPSLAIDYQVNVKAEDYANNYFTFKGPVASANKDQFDATSGASKLESTLVFNYYRNDILGKKVMPGGLRSLFLYPVADDGTRTGDGLQAKKNADGSITVRYAHRGTAYEVTTDTAGKLSFPGATFKNRKIGYIVGAGPQIISPLFSLTTKAADIDWAKVWDARIPGGQIIGSTTNKTGDIVEDVAASELYAYEGALQFSFDGTYLRIKGELAIKDLGLPAPAADATSSASEEWDPRDKYAETPLEITLIETSDVHGMIFPYNFITAKPTATSLAQVSSLVAEERASGSNVVLLDNGDSLQGQPTVYYYNFEKNDVPHVWGQALNELKYDAIGVGNHDIEAGHPVYDKLYRETAAPVLCANAVKPDGTPYFKPYTIIERQGVKIAVLGLITPKIPDWLPPQFWTGMKFEDMVVSAKKWVPIIMQQEKPDVLVGLFHAGVDYSYGGTTKDTPNNENAAQLVAEQVPGFDLIFVGHDHQGWDGMGWDPANKKKAEVKDPNGKTVYIFGALNDAKKIPVVKLMMSWNKDSKTWSKYIRGGLVDMTAYQTDPLFIAKLKPAYDAVKTWVDRPVGKMEGTISTQDSMFGDSAFVDLIHQIQLELCADPAMGLQPAQISFAAPLAFNATIPSSSDGTLYVRDMFNLYVYENFLYTMSLTGKQVRDFLEFSYQNWFETMPNEGNHIIAFQKDKDGKLVQDARSGAYQTATRYYNYDSAAGINYTVDVSKPVGERVTITSMSDGSLFDPEETYTVAINSYRAQGGGGHLEKGAGIPRADVLSMKYVTSATTKDLRYYLLKWFEKQTGTIMPVADGNWSILPEDLSTLGIATDKPLLYPPAK